jgi:PAS domain S-box-containing protein
VAEVVPLESETRLRENAERLRLALAAGAIGTWDYYPATGRLVWDERCKQIHGVAPDAPVSYELFEQTIHPDDSTRVSELIQRMLDPLSGGLYVVEFRVIRQRDGVERWISVRGSVLFDETGRATRFIGTTQDITEQRLAAETRERLLGVVGHDLRGPLSAIRSAAALLASHSPPDRQRFAKVILRSVDRMAAMITQILDYTRVRLGGGIALELDLIDLGALAEHIVDEVSLAHGGKQRPRVNLHDDCCGYWDRTRLGQLLANLVNNALLYGAPERTVTVSLWGTPAEVVLEVHNDGRPIPPELLPIIFEPFRRGAAGSATSREGLGLGLYIAQQIVIAHGGVLRVHSTEASGTTFRAELPRDARRPRSDTFTVG